MYGEKNPIKHRYQLEELKPFNRVFFLHSMEKEIKKEKEEERQVRKNKMKI